MNLPFLKSGPGDQTVEVEGIFNAPLERVYRAWTEPEELMRWFGPVEGILLAVECDLQIGGRICFEFETTNNLRSAIEGEYLLIEPDRKLVFSWSHVVVRRDGVQEATERSKVNVFFEQLETGTKLRLVHSGVTSQEGRDGISQGWPATLVRLQSFFGK